MHIYPFYNDFSAPRAMAQCSKRCISKQLNCNQQYEAANKTEVWRTSVFIFRKYTKH